MEKLVKRAEYLDFLIRHRDKHIIKVVSGVRRSGKSILFYQFQSFLKEQGISDDQLLSINFEDMKNLHLTQALALYEYIQSIIKPDRKYYLFLDEIQVVDDFERVIDSLFLNPLLDIYITGSNGYFLSGELATFLSGRYVKLDMLPLSFKEYVNWHKSFGYDSLSNEEYYNLYIKTSFPYALNITDNFERFEYLQGLYSTTVLKDIIQRLEIQDARVLERVIETLLSSIGSLVTINKLKNTLHSKGFKISHQTLDRMIKGLLDSLIFYECKKYDIRGRKLLETQGKYYCVDVGLRNLLLRDHLEDFGRILENIVFLELKRRGYQVYVGNNEKNEIDFIAIKPDQSLEYFQIALTTLELSTLNREMNAFKGIEDNYPKYLLTMDTFNKEANYGGIIKMNVLDWLLQ